MTEDTLGVTVSIGELSRRTGVPVRTIRFYCDNGILESRRSGGGHRTFFPAAVDRLLLVRRLRAMGLPLAAISNVLDGKETIAEAAAAERAAIDAELEALRWRRAALAAIENAPPDERAGRLKLLAAVHDRSAVIDSVVAFWRPILRPLPPEEFDSFIDMNVPPLPNEPAPDQVVAYAELATMTTDPQVKTAMTHQIWRSDGSRISDRRTFVTAVASAFEVAAPVVAAHESPRPGVELDQFVHAHAAARKERDTHHFRRSLLATGTTDTDPRIHRFWRLTADITGSETTVGAIHYWLLDALRQTV
ncbi:DNA-binding transcriptional MerR regulator [Nocardia tenerifensis]|uniref:DNA-binding transcriptional MerR regulator n=1 Tax=Nocardia tenerifensis TaxID=228006 RepID=A0A318K194_9NOCA|nr:MerR family transcriptional regulator [Nocardia tenerifensis]PXX60935.1 DNA-binding transcriptional MerR regulator [Nocardia tenerifensis]